MSDPTPATWRIVLAAILDFVTIFFAAGFVIGWLSGGLTETGFALHGLPAVALLIVLVGYFWLGRRLGGTLWQRLLRARR